MRIGITCYPGVGGSGLLATHLAVELAQRGHEIHLITYEIPYLLQEGRYENVTVDLVNVLEYPLFRYPPYTVALASEMANIAKLHELDLLHVHYAIPHAVSAYLARQITGIPYVVTLHGSDVHTLGADPAYQLATRFAVEAANAVTCVSKHICQTADQTLGIRCKINPITNFIDANRFKSGPCLHGWNHQGKHLVHVSNFRPVKRVVDLITAFAQIADQIPDAHLLLLGDGPTRSDVERIVCDLDLTERVRYLGFKRDVETYLRCAQGYALCSELEGAPLSLLEAMSCSLPVVATEVGGIPEIIKDGENGLLVPFGDLDALANRLYAILTDDVLSQKLGENARATILSNHTAEKVVPQYEAVYESVVPR
ncbi:MAG: N-acetyl-alpha-D-glucosaminyl L-malate synthase BshA [Promethearchaeota archaeon]